MKPGIPKGTRDFSPGEMIRRNYVFDLIKDVFKKFGFEEIETPAMENLSSLEGKYGEEGDKLLFRILNSGPVIDEIRNKKDVIRHSDVTEKGLRYDLTVPFARYVVMHQNEITFPFRRYQIQPVWRADRPQKGRYREFYQCDADVIGSTSLFSEVELIRIIDEVFRRLVVGFSIKLNNRKILAGIAEVIQAPHQLIDITVALDKLDKIGQDKVNDELLNKGISKTAIDKIQPLLLLNGTNNEKITALKLFLKESEVGMKGIGEIELIFEILKKTDADFKMPKLDISLARGLNYYTGAIIEVKADDKRSAFTSSICGGGRYDDLTGIFGLPNVSGVGISFGADRICDVLDEVNGYPDFSGVTTRILFANFGMEEAIYCFRIINQLREGGIGAELYPDAAKMKKQMSYADEKKIPFVALIGSDEMKRGEITIKNMKTGEQSVLNFNELLQILK